MSVVLRASGTSFDVDEFGRRSHLVACKLFRRGERRGSSGTLQSSGANISVGDDSIFDLDLAVEEAIAFLEKHAGDLKQLRTELAIEAMVLDFAVARRDTFTESDILPARLLRLTGNLGIDVCISHYPVSPPE